MSQAPASAPPQSAATDAHAALLASPLVQSAARWFWWIAGLSLINTVLTLTGTHMQLVVGLGLTLVSDVTFGGASPLGFAIDALALAFFFFMGRQAQRGQLWAFYLGIAVYCIDALVYVRFQDWMAVAFHGVVIYFIVRGLLVLRKGPAAAR